MNADKKTIYTDDDGSDDLATLKKENQKVEFIYDASRKNTWSQEVEIP